MFGESDTPIRVEIMAEPVPPDFLPPDFVTPEVLGVLLDRHAAALELYARSGAARRKMWCNRRSCNWPGSGRRPSRR